MNIGGRGQVAVEANTVQRSATQSHAGGQVSARVRRVSEPSVRDSTALARR
jgi:hypothetical protein